MHIHHVLRTFAAVIVTVTMLGAHTAAAEDGRTISGVALGSVNNECVPTYAWFSLVDLSGILDTVVYSDSYDGTFVFHSIPDGTYRINATGGPGHGGSEIVTVAGSDFTDITVIMSLFIPGNFEERDYGACAHLVSGSGDEEPGNGNGDVGEEPGNGG